MLMTSFDATSLSQRVEDFLKGHATELKEVASRLSDVFEAVCYVFVAQYYKDVGYKLEPKNLIEGYFRFRNSTQGNPWNFSYFTASGHGIKVLDKSRNVVNEWLHVFEIRHNQKVAGAWGSGLSGTGPPSFSVDIAVVFPDSLTHRELNASKQPGDQIWVAPKDLITFAEVKKFQAHPMLLAQFLGIVHEIMPECLGVPGSKSTRTGKNLAHILPVLFTVGEFTLGSRLVLDSFQSRGLKVCVIARADSSPVTEILVRLRDSAKSL